MSTDRFERVRDPRLVEIDFLMDADEAGSIIVRCAFGEATSFAQVGSRQTRYKLDPLRFRDLVLGLLMDGAVVGLGARGDGAGVTEAQLSGERGGLIMLLTGGHAVNLVVSHAGRVRMWTLRDQLLRDPDLEPMGLRSKTAWERDLFLQLRWATKDEALSIIFLDLDNFGAVNKDRGSSVGDEVLRTTFSLARNFVGSRGAVYRFGGEEVGVLLPKTELDVACRIAEELRCAIELEVAAQVSRLGRVQTASFGVSTFVKNIDPVAALDFVDELMREAKGAGKNTVVARPFHTEPAPPESPGST